MLDRAAAQALQKAAAVATAAAINVALWFDAVPRLSPEWIAFIPGAFYGTFAVLLLLVPTHASPGWRHITAVLADAFIAFVIFCAVWLLFSPKTVT